jgi:beta-glucosidase
MFDVFPGNTPPDPRGFDDEAEMRRAVNMAGSSDLAVVVVGEWQHLIGEGASRSSL